MGILTVGGALRRGHDDAGMAATVARGRAPDYGFAFSTAVSKSVFFASLVIAAKVATIVCVIELAIMLVFSVLPFAPQGVAAAMLDAILLALITAPLILLWVIRPFIAARHSAYEQLANMNRMLRREIDERMAAEEKLRAHEYDLELQIQEIDYVKQLVEEQAANAVGIAAYPADAADEQVLLRCADRAMYAAKERGHNCAVFYHDLESAAAGH